MKFSLHLGVCHCLAIFACTRAVRYAEGGGSSPFRALTALLVGGNNIKGWSSIDEIDRFPLVSSLRLSGNPHPAEDSAKRYQVIGTHCSGWQISVPTLSGLLVSSICCKPTVINVRIIASIVISMEHRLY